jgi:prepilin-type N-terminal cleavage/methylation domain-containing protein
MRRAARRSGFTLLEMIVSVAIFTVLTFTLASAVKMAHGSHRAVMDAVAENSSLRRSRDNLLGELKAANGASIAVSAQPDGNDQLTLQLPIEVEGNPVWGVAETKLSSDPAEQVKEGWTVRYTVIAAAMGGGAVDRQLVRQVVDDKGDVQVQVVIAKGLRSGANVPRGFSVVAAGDLWEVSLAFESSTDGGVGKGGVFHVRTRN